MSFDLLLIRDHLIRGDGQRDFLRELEGSPLPLPEDSLPDAGEARNDFWSLKETSYTVRGAVSTKVSDCSSFARVHKGSNLEPIDMEVEDED